MKKTIAVLCAALMLFTSIPNSLTWAQDTNSIAPIVFPGGHGDDESDAWRTVQFQYDNKIYRLYTPNNIDGNMVLYNFTLKTNVNNHFSYIATENKAFKLTFSRDTAYTIQPNSPGAQPIPFGSTLGNDLEGAWIDDWRQEHWIKNFFGSDTPTPPTFAVTIIKTPEHPTAEPALMGPTSPPPAIVTLPETTAAAAMTVTNPPTGTNSTTIAITNTPVAATVVSAANQVAAEKFYAQGNMYDRKKDYREAISYYLQAAKLGKSDADVQIANYYYYGKGVIQNYRKARDWDGKAAELGNHVAQGNLANMYETGTGMPAPNKNQAIYWYQQAYANGQGIQEAKAKLDVLHAPYIAPTPVVTPPAAPLSPIQSEATTTTFTNGLAWLFTPVDYLKSYLNSSSNQQKQKLNDQYVSSSVAKQSANTELKKAQDALTDAKQKQDDAEFLYRKALKASSGASYEANRDRPDRGNVNYWNYWRFWNSSEIKRQVDQPNKDQRATDAALDAKATKAVYENAIQRVAQAQATLEKATSDAGQKNQAFQAASQQVIAVQRSEIPELEQATTDAYKKLLDHSGTIMYRDYPALAENVEQLTKQLFGAYNQILDDELSHIVDPNLKSQIQLKEPDFKKMQDATTDALAKIAAGGLSRNAVKDSISKYEKAKGMYHDLMGRASVVFQDAVEEATFLYILDHTEDENYYPGLREQWNQYINAGTDQERENAKTLILAHGSKTEADILKKWNYLFKAAGIFQPGGLQTAIDKLKNSSWFSDFATHPEKEDSAVMKELRKFAGYLAGQDTDHPCKLSQDQFHNFYCTTYKTNGGYTNFLPPQPPTSDDKDKTSKMKKTVAKAKQTADISRQATAQNTNEGASVTAGKAVGENAVQGSRADDPFNQIDCSGAGVEPPPGGSQNNPSLDTKEGPGVPTPSTAAKDNTKMYKYIMAAGVGAMVGMLIAAAMFPMAWVAPLGIAGAILMIIIYKCITSPPGAPPAKK